MSSVKVKTIKKPQIDLSHFKPIRNVDIDYKELDTFIKENSEITPKGSDNQYLWDALAPHPEFIQDICNQAKAIFSLDKNIKQYCVSIYPPAAKVDPNKTTTLKRVSRELMAAISSRIILVIGSNEVFNLFVSTEKDDKQHSAESNIRLLDTQGFVIKIALVSGTDISWTDNTSIQDENKNGWRVNRSVKKFPIKRYVIVIDCVSDPEAMIKSLKREAANMCNSETLKTNKLAQQFKQFISPEIQSNKYEDESDIDKIAAIAAKAGDNPPNLNPPETKHTRYDD